MRKITLSAALVAALIWMSIPAVAATAGEFYASLLRRGVAAFEAERFDEASRHLRLAAFGFIENIDQYQTAHAYLAATFDRLGDPERARDSVRRIAQAQRIQPRFAALSLPATVRAAVERHAAGVLTPAEISGLRATAAMPSAAPAQPPPTRTTTTTAPPTTTPATIPPTTAATTPRNPPPATATTTTTTTTTNPPVTVDRIVVEEVKAPPATQTQTHTGTNHNPPATATPSTTAPPTRPAPATTTTQPPPAQPAPTQPRVQPPAPTTTTTTATPARPPAPAPAYTAAERATRFAAAERALATNNLTEARRIYTELLASRGLDRDSYIRLAEGFYRSRHFAGALAAFERAGALRRGEEPYRYYIAVALYETGQYALAKSELTAALPYIEVTPDVARYRTKIQSAVQ